MSAELKEESLGKTVIGIRSAIIKAANLGADCQLHIKTGTPPDVLQFELKEPSPPPADFVRLKEILKGIGCVQGSDNNVMLFKASPGCSFEHAEQFRILETNIATAGRGLETAAEAKIPVASAGSMANPAPSSTLSFPPPFVPRPETKNPSTVIIDIEIEDYLRKNLGLKNGELRITTSSNDNNQVIISATGSRQDLFQTFFGTYLKCRVNRDTTTSNVYMSVEVFNNFIKNLHDFPSATATANKITSNKGESPHLTYSPPLPPAAVAPHAQLFAPGGNTAAYAQPNYPAANDHKGSAPASPSHYTSAPQQFYSPPPSPVVPTTSYTPSLATRGNTAAYIQPNYYPTASDHKGSTPASPSHYTSAPQQFYSPPSSPVVATTSYAPIPTAEGNTATYTQPNYYPTTSNSIGAAPANPSYYATTFQQLYSPLPPQAAAAAPHAQFFGLGGGAGAAPANPNDHASASRRPYAAPLSLPPAAAAPHAQFFAHGSGAPYGQPYYHPTAGDNRGDMPSQSYYGW